MGSSTQTANSTEFTHFEELLICYKNHYGISLLLLLAWVACCDGHASDDELRQIRQIIQNTPEAEITDEVISIAKGGDLPAIQCACEIIRASHSQEKAQRLFSLMVLIAIADGYIRPSEIYVLQFLADLLGLTQQQVETSYSEITGKSFPSTPDPSKAEWWKERTAKKKQSNSSSSGQSSNSSKTSRTMSMARLKALAMLGLDEDASALDIRSAYRRLAHVHHPDRFANLGPEAASAASESFRRIKDAYEFVTANA